MLQVVEGKKAGSRYYIEDGYLYKQNSKTGDTLYLKCISPGCKARATIKDLQLNVTKDCHNHAKDPEEIEKFRFREALLASSSKSNATVKDVYYNVAERHPSAAVEYPFPTAEWRMRKRRKGIIPPISRSLCTLRDLLESEVWQHLGDIILTSRRPFFRCLLQDEAGVEILIFVSPEISPILNDTSIIYMDGTFKIVPHGLTSYQMTTIHANFHNKVYPAVYALMNRHTKEAYILLLNYIKFLFPGMCPTESMTDFEIAERLAIREAFPNITTRGCWFHFAQAVFKKHQQLGLCALSSGNTRCRKILQMLMSVPLLPIEMIPDGIRYIENEITRANLTTELSALMSYMWEYWINVVGSTVISAYGCSHRTNNKVENFHLQLFRQGGKQPHPSLWDFIRILKEMDRNLSLTFQSHQSGARHVHGGTQRSIFQDSRIRKAEQHLSLGAYTIGVFLEEVSHSVSTLEKQLRFEFQGIPTEREENGESSESVDDLHKCEIEHF